MLLVAAAAAVAAPKVNDTPAELSDRAWGFRPEPGTALGVTPPSFSWRPQEGAESYVLQVSRDPSFEQVEYEAADLPFNVHTPPRTLDSGEWHWRFRYVTGEGEKSSWSKTRRFTIGEEAEEFPLPSREELIGRIPDRHPRLFVRPEQLPRLRELAEGELEPIYNRLVERCKELLADPPSTEEPPKYPPGTERLSEEWRKIWWGNRERTVEVLNSAATLGFTYLLDGNEEYGQLARKLLMAAAEWDPKGATGYRYNDEAGMPYAYYFSRTYTFIHDLLSEAEREKCQAVMKIRGEEMYDHLHPSHFWRPYGSHRNRAWHFLGEVGIAFHGEIEGADDWTWFAMNVFANTYPVWSGPDGGWHEGLAYWRSYIHRFTWWADVMKTAVGVDAYRKPYFSKAGYWPMYLQPPGTQAGGFGDHAFTQDSSDNTGLMSILATQAGNPYWQWYVEQHGGAPTPSGYIDFVRGAAPAVEAQAPEDLPSSRVFRGIGQAALNTNLLDGEKNISILFKASPFGTQSHGYESQNAFQLYAFGQPLLIRTGKRDIYGSDHHRNWMFETESVNSILVNGEGQIKHSAAATGRISGFHTGDAIDFVEGEAGEAYGDRLERFTRSILFIKPGVVVIFDRLKAPEPATYQWLLHAPTEMDVAGQHQIGVRNGEAACRVNLLYPGDLKVSQTDKFEPPPRERVDLRQFHLTAETSDPAAKQAFITVIHPHREGDAPPDQAKLREIDGGYAVRAPLNNGEALILLRTEPGATLSHDGVRADADVAAVRFDESGEVVERFASGDAGVEVSR